MAVMIEYRIVYIIMSIFNVILHGIGLTFLVRLYKRGEKSPQRKFLMNLSLFELIQNILAFIDILFSLMLRTKKIPTNDQTLLFRACINNIRNTSAQYSVTTAMFVLTGDRLMSVILGIRYPSFWTFRKTVVLLSCMWSFNLLVTIAVCVYTYHETYFSYQIQITVAEILNVYIPTANSIIFLLFAVIAYFIMFNKFYSSHQNARSTNQPNQSRLQAFRQSKFYICVMLLTSFLILMVIPLTSYTIYSTSTGWFPPNPVYIYLDVSLLLSDSVDALIYIFLQPSVKKLFLKTFCWWCCTGDSCRGCCSTSQNPPENNISLLEKRGIGNDQQGDCNQSEDNMNNPHDGIITSTRL